MTTNDEILDSPPDEPEGDDQQAKDGATGTAKVDERELRDARELKDADDDV
jgi:hypothetical protein